MVRRRIEMKPIEDDSKRHTTFTKRRHGLIKKAKELFQNSGSEGAIISFSKAGNAYVFAHPDIDVVLNRYRAEYSSALASEAGNSGVGLVHVGGGTESESESEAEAEAPLTEVDKRIHEGLENGGWKEEVHGLGPEELDELYAEMEKLKRKVEREIAAAEDNQEGGSSVGDSRRDCST